MYFNRIALVFYALTLLAQTVNSADFRFEPLEPIQYKPEINPRKKLPLNWQNGDRELQSKLNSLIKKNFFWRTLSDRKQLAIGLIDMSDIQNPRAAWINGDNMMYSASMPKIAVLATALDQIHLGNIKVDSSLLVDMNAMIRYSNNQATNLVIDRVGFDLIEKTMRKYDLYNEDKGGGLWVGKLYSKDNFRRGDPYKGLSHGATVRKACQLFYLIGTGQLGGVESSRLGLSVLQSPGLHHKFIHSMLKAGYNADRLFRKSGSWQNYHSDSMMALGEVGQKRFILVAISETKYGEQLMKDLAASIEKMLPKVKSKNEVIEPISLIDSSDFYESLITPNN